MGNGQASSTDLPARVERELTVFAKSIDPKCAESQFATSAHKYDRAQEPWIDPGICSKAYK